MSTNNIRRATDEIININVGGKRFVTRRSTLCADPNSKLAEWFRTQSTRSVPQDKAGNYFLDRDGKTFRMILSYLRLKKERGAVALAVPVKPDDLARVIGECDILRLDELRDLCHEMLHRYQREESNYVAAYVNNAVREYEQGNFGKVPGSKDVYEMDNYTNYGNLESGNTFG